MSVREPRVPNDLNLPLSPNALNQPLEPIFPTLFVVVPWKRATLGERVYPFAGLRFVGPSGIASARWRIDGGVFNPVVKGNFTDILAATRFVSEVKNTYKTFLYEVELTDELGNVRLTPVHVPVEVLLGAGKAVANNSKFRPFAEAVIAEDPTQLNSVKYSVEGDQTVAKTVIPRTIFYTGTHSGVNNSADLVSVQTFTDLEIRTGTDIVKNTTDGSQGVITSATGNTIVATLAGGVENDWDVGDAYEIVDGDDLVQVAQRFEFQPTSIGFLKINLFAEDLALNESSAFTIVGVI